jgi:predicted nucleic acid-binding protein
MGNKKIYVDATVLISILLENHPENSTAHRFFVAATQSETTVFVSVAVISMCFLLLRTDHNLYHRLQFINQLRALANSPDIEVENKNEVLYTLHLLNGNPNLDFLECYLAATAYIHQSTVGTYDGEIYQYLGASYVIPPNLPLERQN